MGNKLNFKKDVGALPAHATCRAPLSLTRSWWGRGDKCECHFVLLDLTSQYYLELVVLLHAVAAALAFSRAHELYIIQHDTMCQKNSLRGLRTRFFFAKGGRRAAQNSLEKHDEKWVKNLTPRAPAPGQTVHPTALPRRRA